MIDFQTLQDLSGGAVEADTTCPLCSSARKAINRNKKVLRIWNPEPGFATYNCTHCGASGSARDAKSNGHLPAESEDHVAKALMAAINKTPAPRTLDKVYDYVDANGKLLYQKLRYIPKTFEYRRPNGIGGWIGERGDRVVPYRLPELLQYHDATIFLCEGEKDADRVASLGYCATNVAQKDLDDETCAAYFAGHDVVILRDNDGDGIKRAFSSATALHGKAKTIRIVNMPDGAKDVSDWLNLDPDNVNKLEKLCFDTPLWNPSQSVPQANDDKIAKSLAEALHPSQAKVETPPKPLRWLDMSNWDSEAIPERDWVIFNRVPAEQFGIFSGEGGVGKSIIELSKDIAHVTGKDWLGSLPEIGPVIYIGTEDSEKELHIRIAAIAKHYGVTFKELIEAGLKVLPLIEEDSTLVTVSTGGKVETTKLYKQIYEAAGDIKPINISIDPLSAIFAGNENDRPQAYAFRHHMLALAQVSRCERRTGAVFGGSVTVLSHPSLHGMSSGSGLSGNTGWHGAPRFRQYLKGIKDDEGEQEQGDLRELQFKKVQYGPAHENIVLRYEAGVFVPVRGVSSLEKAAQGMRAEEIFISLLRRYQSDGRPVSHNKKSNNYAPTVFATEPEAKKAELRRRDLDEALVRLFSKELVVVETYGPPSRGWSRLVEKARQ
jgi:RecA-family ATPase